jgi:tetratricopeptide (TPR) repeat protein
MVDLYEYAYQQYIFQLREQEDTVDSQISKLREKLAAVSPQEKSMIEVQIDSQETTKNVIRSKLTEPLPPSESIPAGYFYFHGNAFFKLKKYPEAYAQYIKAIKIDPNHGNAYNNLANLYYMTKQHQKALDCLNKAEANGVKINPELKKAILKTLGK